VHLPYSLAIIARFRPFVKGAFLKKSAAFFHFFGKMCCFPKNAVL